MGDLCDLFGDDFMELGLGGGDEPETTELYSTNLCHQQGIVLSGIQFAYGLCVDHISLVKDFRKNGDPILHTPLEGLPFCHWEGGFARNHIALLACVAMHGYHSLVDYQWFRDGVPMAMDVYPIVYVEASGTYVCTIRLKAKPETVLYSTSFEVKRGTSEFQVVLMSGVDQGPMTVQCEVVVGVDQGPMIAQSEVVVGNAAEEHFKELVKAKSTVNLGNEEEFKELHLITEIGRGSFGTVHKALWLGTIVAAKVVNADPGTRAHETLLSEINIIRTLNHPNILHLLGVVPVATGIAILTNFVRSNLYSVIFNEDIVLTNDDKMMMALQVTQALSYCHSLQPPIAHLDVKPANILVERDSKHIYLGDFGLTRILTGTVRTHTSTKGTPGFQAPEVLEPEGGGMTTACDIYSLGCVMIELFSRRFVWRDLQLVAILTNVAVRKLGPPTDDLEPEHLKQLCIDCTLYDPRDRPKAYVVIKRLLDMAVIH